MGIMWNPWHGCHKCSPGCANCYVFYLDSKREKDSNVITKSKTNFDLPKKKDRNGNYKIPANTEVPTCFTSDFFIEEADEWRKEAWAIIESRPDVDFLICTKRVERIESCLPEDWGEGYDNVILAATCENQAKSDERLPIFLSLKVKRRYIFVAPILEYVDLKPYLDKDKIALVSVGGESYQNARICDFEWVKKIKEDCDEKGVLFDFHQTGSNFKKGNKIFKIRHHEEYAQAKKGQAYLERKNEKLRHKSI